MKHNKLMERTLDRSLPVLSLRSVAVKRRLSLRWGCRKSRLFSIRGSAWKNRPHHFRCTPRSVPRERF